MKNNFFDEVFLCKRKLKKLMQIMKFTMLFSFALSINMWATDNSLSTSAGMQQMVVKGVITDDATGEALPGANVQIKGTTKGVVTDIDGKYSIEVKTGDILVFSFIGYLAEEIPFQGQVDLNVALTPDIKSLDEVVVIGYGTSKKSDITGSVVSVSTDDMMKKAPTNILQGLKGMAAGVVISAQDGAPDANSAVYIRGIATINGTSKPLYVIDGVPVGDNANFLNPSDIERIEVLKDASATAIYGSAGANGVIMVTTKRGSVGKAHIAFQVDMGLQTLARELDVTDANTYGRNIRLARANDGNAVVNPIFTEAYDGQRKTINWQREMTRPALRQQYNLSATGGSENTQYNASVGYLYHDGLVVNSNMNRLNSRVSVTAKAADFLEFSGDISFAHTESHGSNAGIGNNGNLSSLRDMAFYCPTMDYVQDGVLVSPNAENSNGTFGSPIQGATGVYDALMTENPYASQMEQAGKSQNNLVLLNAGVSVKLLKGLTFKSVGAYKFTTGNYHSFSGNTKRFMPDGVTEVERYNYDDNYRLTINNNNGNNLSLESYLTYNWTNEVHNLTAMAGYSVSRYFGYYSNVGAVDFPGANIRDIGLTSVPSSKTASGAYNTEARTLSYFGRLTYSFKDRYILTGTIRRDGSSNFGVDNLWGTFPSAALAWRVSEEDFLKGNSTISNLKLRFGWGQTGNAGNIGSRATAALTSNTIQYFYYPTAGVAGFGSNRILYNGTVSTLVDPSLKWETNQQTNFGIDLGVLNNALNITVDYFIRDAKDLLLYRNVRPSAGATQIYTNYGEISNKGIEFSVDYKKRVSNDLHLGATLTGSSVKNEIKGIGVDQFFVNEGASGDGSNQGQIGTVANVHWDGHSIMRDGYAVGSFYGYEVEGIFQSQEEVDEYNAAALAAGHTDGWYQLDKTGPGDFKYRDLDGDGFIDPDDMTILGNGFPKLNLGLTLNASYKNWDISIYSYGVFGAKINSYSAMTLTNMFGSDNGTVPNILQEVSDDAWTPENGSNETPKLSLLDYNRNMRGSDAWVKKGNYYKIGNIQVAYNFSGKLLTPLRIESARIAFSVQNLLTISPYKKYGDPEIGQGSVLFTGLDTGRYPMPRTYAVGLTLQF